MKTRVLVMMGGPSTEHDVSLASGRMVALALNPAKYEVGALIIRRNGLWEVLKVESLQEIEPKARDVAVPQDARGLAVAGLGHAAAADLVFVALHGSFGEDGTVQGMLEALDIPYTGSGPLASGLAMDKHKAKELFGLYGLKVPRGLMLTAESVAEDAGAAARRCLVEIGLPAVVKPVRGGSSVGASVVDDAAALADALASAARLDEAVLVEEALGGVEVTCAVLENEAGEPEALPLIEIVPPPGTFFDFERKYDPKHGAQEIVPARLPADATAACQEAAVTAHRALGCEGFSRVDMFWTEDGPVVLELNTIPGMTPNSLLPKAAAAAGIGFGDLVGRLVEQGLRRSRRRHRPR